MSLYNLKSTPTPLYSITKFTDDLDVEATYSVARTACDCPAGARASCRHRQMLPTLLERVDTAWFYDFDLKSWSDPTGQALLNDDQIAHLAMVDEGLIPTDPTGEANKPATAAEAEFDIANEGTKLHKSIEQIHDLYQTGDEDAPDLVKDRNGEVVLGLCRRCGKAEAQLIEPCADEGFLSNEEPIAPKAEPQPSATNHSGATALSVPGPQGMQSLTAGQEDMGSTPTDLHTVTLGKPAPAFKRRL